MLALQEQPEASCEDASRIAQGQLEEVERRIARLLSFRDELARTATGKLQKFKLRAPYWEGMEKQIN